MRPRTRLLGGAAVLAAATAAGGVVAAPGGEEATGPAQHPPAHTVTVEQGALASVISLNGVLTYRARRDGSPYSAVNQAEGTYTALPDAGDKVDCGDVLYRVDDDPVLLLCGTVPTYRDLSGGDEGRDVRQLNRSLHRLGYDADAGVDIDPDDHDFTWSTEQALRTLQDAKGFEETGTFGADDAVFLPRSVRIAELTGKLGEPARPGAPVAQATSHTPEVQVNLDASQQGEVIRGDRAQVTLPGNAVVQARVDRLGSVARTGEDEDAGDATIPAYLTLDKPRQARGLDRAPVRVEITTEGVERALSVPVTAVVGRSGGGFAVEVVRDGGRREVVAVQLGLFDTANGRVEVEGDLAAGDDVVVPSP